MRNRRIPFLIRLPFKIVSLPFRPVTQRLRRPRTKIRQGRIVWLDKKRKGRA
jgi:hypothetical protein